MPDASAFIRLRRLEAVVAGNDGISRLKLRAPVSFSGYTAAHRVLSLPPNAIGSNKFPKHRPPVFNPGALQTPRPYRPTNPDPNASVARGGTRASGGGANSTPEGSVAGGNANSQQTSNMRGGDARG